MKKTKEQKIKKDYSLLFIIAIGIFVIISACIIYALKYSGKYTISTVTSNESYSIYLSNMKKNINALQEDNCYEKNFEITNYNSSEDTFSTTITVSINSNEEAYINFEEDTKLAKNYDNNYKLADDIIQLFEIDASSQSIDKFIFMLKEDGTLLYINSNDLENGNIELKTVNNVKNIVNVDLKTSYTSDTNKTIIAIDIDGNMYELNDLIG